MPPHRQPKKSLKSRARRRRWFRWSLVSVAVLGLLVVLANGPGFRLLVSKVLSSKLAKAGLSGVFEVDGTALGGVRISNAELTGTEAVRKLAIGEAEVGYDLLGLLQKKGIAAIGPIIVRGVEVEVIRPPGPRKTVGETLRELGKAWEGITGAATLDVSASDVNFVSRDENGAPLVDLQDGALELAGGEGSVSFDRLQLAEAEPLLTLSGGLRVHGSEIELSDVGRGGEIAIKSLTVGPPPGGEGWPSARGALTLFGGDLELAVEDERRLLVKLVDGEIDLGVLARRFDKTLPVTGTVRTLDMSVAGQFEEAGSLDVSGEIAAGALEGFGIAGVDGRARLGFRGGVLTVEQCELVRGANTVHGTGVVEVGAAKKGEAPDLHFELELDLPEVGEIAQIYAVPVAGAIKGAVAFGLRDGRLDGIGGDLSAAPLLYGEAVVDAVNVVAQPEGGSSKVTASVALAGSNTAQIAGTFDFTDLIYNAEGDSSIDEIAALVPLMHELGIDLSAVDGAGEVVWKGDGRLKEKIHQGTARISGLSISAADSPPVLGELTIGYAPGQLSATDCAIEYGQVVVGGNVRLADKQLVVDAVRVRSTTSAGGGELAKIDAVLPFDFAALKSVDSFFDQAGEVKLNIESAGLPVADLLPLAGDVAWGGKIDAAVQIGGTLADLVGDGKLALRGLRPPAEKVEPADADLKFDLRDRRVTLDGEVRQRGLPAITLNGSAPIRPREIASDPAVLSDQGFDLRAKFPETELAKLIHYAPVFASAEGVVGGELRVTGTTAEPVLTGHLHARASRVKLRGAGMPSIADLALDIGFEGDRATVETGRVTLAGGKLALAGGARFVTLKDPELSLALNAREALLYRDESMSLRANGELTLEGAWSKAKLAGRLGIIHSQFVREIEILPIGLPRLQKTPPVPRAPALETKNNIGVGVAPFANWTIDVVVETDEPFQVRSNLAHATVLADLRVTGTGAKPVPVGSIRLGEGSEATLPFSVMKVREGILEFDAKTGFDPRVRFSGVSEVRDYEITLRVYDHLSNPRTLITSNPPLPEEEAVALLATGRTSSELNDSEVVAGAAASLLWDKVRRRVLKRTGAPKNPFGERVEFKAGALDPKTGNRTASATYRVTDRVYLLGGVDTEGDYRGLLKLLIRVR